jgi:hypothetical protein
MLAGCDGFNTDIDDLSRDLAIYVRLLTDVENGGWDDDDVAYQDVTSSDGTASDTSVGTVVVSPLQDSYVRSDNVTITPTDGSAYVFAYWLFPSRTDEEIDDESTEGNIRYDDSDDGETVSLRTDSDPAELIGVFALDGGNTTSTDKFTSFVYSTSSSDSYLTYVLSGDSDIVFSITLLAANPVSTYTISNPQFRIFDGDGEAQTEWEDFIDSDDLDFDAGDSYTFSYTLEGADDRSDVDNWTIILIYEDSSGDAYVVK